MYLGAFLPETAQREHREADGPKQCPDGRTSFHTTVVGIGVKNSHKNVASDLKIAGLTFVVLGNAAKIRDAVKKYSDQVVEVPVTVPGFRN